MVQLMNWAGWITAVSLWTGIYAQSSEDILSVSSRSFSTTTRDSLASETSAVSLAAPTGTGQPCGRIAAAVETSSSSYRVAVPAELAYECLTSVPLRPLAALATIDGIVKMVQFQSNLAYLKNPPDGYDNPPVDILGGLADIRNKASDNEYANQYDFEAEIATLLDSARDGHLGFDGITYAGAVRWRRDIILVSLSQDGGPSKIYNLVDFNHTSSPSPVSRIDGEDVDAFLQEEASRVAYHDPDARWNSLFYRLPAQNFGYFGIPRWYPGPTTTISFENGTEQTYTNRAILQEENSWSDVSDGDSFYSIFVDPSSARTVRRQASLRTAPHVPTRLQQVREILDDGDADVPVGYPEPYITGPTEVYINGYFMDHPNIRNLAVLALQTFDTETDADARRFQSLIEQFLAEAKSRGTEKVIIDLQSNGGGRVFLGYDAFRQFFPDIEPFGGGRYRAHESANILGTEFSRLSFSQNGVGYTSPFNYHSYIDSSNEPFTSWTDMYDGHVINNDNFTNILRYNLSDPNLTSSSTYGDGITITGYLDRSDLTTPPFAASDLILLTDGICSSTCALFLEFMTIEAGVKTIVLGGRPQDGPMQPVGGTKGTNVLDADYLTTFSGYLISEFADNATERRAWASILPVPFPIRAYEASVNFLDNIRRGDEGMTPTQFTNETANCRLRYTAEMATDPMALWGLVADVAWGGQGGGIDEARCVAGSYRRESWLEAPPVSSGGSDAEEKNGEARTGAAAANVNANGLDVRWAVAASLVFVAGVSFL
ncbi:hypothetical protein GJ744_008701 [Endocarpon pusillum]|uniref:CPAF-like PDZ domain-containing protein n=1 Tax=Endocarpon pusillum TaxID=364733 RepID=A0A8H7E360_9EURO|nr:hypothetical protein GJ744_008701 [Endocarpon pusillum]